MHSGSYETNMETSNLVVYTFSKPFRFGIRFNILDSNIREVKINRMQLFDNEETHDLFDAKLDSIGICIESTTADIFGAVGHFEDLKESFSESHTLYFNNSNESDKIKKDYLASTFNQGRKDFYNFRINFYNIDYDEIPIEYLNSNTYKTLIDIDIIFDTNEIMHKTIETEYERNIREVEVSGRSKLEILDK
jgi:hypothetical protein